MIPRGWLNYQAPEILKVLSPYEACDKYYTFQSDIYAFGCVWCVCVVCVCVDGCVGGSGWVVVLGVLMCGCVGVLGCDCICYLTFILCSTISYTEFFGMSC